jgi:hypothetical protein
MDQETQICGIEFEELYRLWTLAGQKDKDAVTTWRAYVTMFHSTSQWEAYVRWHISKNNRLIRRGR